MSDLPGLRPVAFHNLRLPKARATPCQLILKMLGLTDIRVADIRLTFSKLGYQLPTPTCLPVSPALNY